MSDVPADAWHSSKTGAFQWRVGQVEHKGTTLGIIVLKWEPGIYERMGLGVDYATHVAAVTSEKSLPLPVKREKCMHFIATSHLRNALSIINHEGFVESDVMLDFLGIFPFSPLHDVWLAGLTGLSRQLLHETDVVSMLVASGITEYQNGRRFVFWDQNDSKYARCLSRFGRQDSKSRLKYALSRSVNGVQGTLWVAPSLDFTTTLAKRGRRGFTCVGNPAGNRSCTGNKLGIDFKMIWRIVAETYIHRRPFLYRDYRLRPCAGNFSLNGARRDSRGQLHATLPEETVLAPPPISKADPWSVAWNVDSILVDSFDPSVPVLPDADSAADADNDWHFRSGEQDVLWHIFETDCVRQGLLKAPPRVSAKATCAKCGAMFRVEILVDLNRELRDGRCSCGSSHTQSWEEGGATVRHCVQCQTIFGDINKYRPGH